MSSSDSYQATRDLIDHAFSHLTWYEDVCRQTGFKGISQIWKDEPAWYFWQDGIKGAFLLRLCAEDLLQEYPLVNLTLHYFPAPDEEAYSLLSAGEKWLLSAEKSFDSETCTPRFEAYNEFIHLFVAAEIGLVFDSNNDLQVLFFSTECDDQHQVHQFLDLLIKALNFQTKKHQLSVHEMKEDEVTTLLLNYSAPVFDRFLAEFGLDRSELSDLSHTDRAGEWTHIAHQEAICSMTGACSCHH